MVGLQDIKNVAKAVHALNEYLAPKLLSLRLPLAEIAKIVMYLGAYFAAVSVLCFVVLLRFSEMRPHFVSLLLRSWSAFVASQGSTTLGWISSTIAVPILAVVITIALIQRQRGKEAMVSHWKQDAAMTLRVTIFVVLFYYGPLFIWKGIIRTVYDDHQTLVKASGNMAQRANGSIADAESRVKELQRENEELAQKLDRKTHTLDTSDPVFPNIIYLLRAFNIYRHARNGDPCIIRFTAPADSAAMASMVAQFSNSVSGCFTFGPDTNMNPDLDEVETKGMIPGAILIHAEQDDKAANQLETALTNQIQVRRTTKPIPSEISKFSLPPAVTENKKVWVTWLQFGPNVVWNSELSRRRK